jgi:Ceramidase
MKSSMCNYLNLGTPTIQFAENNLSGCIAQPANTFSNIAYLVVAICALYLLRKTKIKPLYLFPFTFAIIGLSSAFYHASATFVGQFFDFFSIYILGSTLLYFAALPFIKTRQSGLLILLAFLTITLGFTLWFAPYLRIVIAFSELFFLIYLEYLNRKNTSEYRWLFTRALQVFILAFGVWLLDLNYIWDIDWLEHYINGHAVWHVLTAVSMWYVFRYYYDREVAKNKL